MSYIDLLTLGKLLQMGGKLKKVIPAAYVKIFDDSLTKDIT